MDEFVWPASSCGPPLSESFVSAVSHHPALEFMSCDDVPEQWLLGDDVPDKHDGEEEPQDGRAIQHPPPAPASPPVAGKRRRGGARKPGPRTGDAPGISHVEAERRRRDRLNRRFCDLRAAVPRVSRMDKASILEDAVAYIAELRRRVEQLEAEAARRTTAAASLPRNSLFGGAGENNNIALEARMIGPEVAALQLTAAAAAARHAPAGLMAALRALDLPVRHACVCRVGGGVTVVDVPAEGLRGEGRLRAALHGLLKESCC